MSDKREHLLLPFSVSIAVHLFIAVLFLSDLVSFDSARYLPVNQMDDLEIVTATAVPQTEIDAIYQRKAEQERKQREAEEQKERVAKAAAEQESRRLELEKKQSEQLVQAGKVKREQLQRAKREAEILIQKEQEQERRQQVATLERQREEKARLAAEAEEQRLRAEREAEEQRLRAEREAEEQHLRAERRLREEQEAAVLRQRKIVVWQKQYVSDIRRSIEKQWKKPRASIKGGDCVVKIRQNKNGKLIEVTVVSCSGDLLYRSSVEDAVWKSDPLPLPPAPDVFENEIEITFKQQY